MALFNCSMGRVSKFESIRLPVRGTGIAEADEWELVLTRKENTGILKLMWA
jgi:hypothetical protein